MNWISNNLNWLIYVFVLAIPVVSSIGKWLQQEAAKKKAEAEKRRRAEAQLRTGRVEQAPPRAPQTAGAPAGDRDRPENFAERRRRQVEELKRRQEVAQRQRDAAQQASSPQSPVPASSAERRRRTPTPAARGGEAVAVAEPPSAEIESLAARFEREAGVARGARRVPRGAGPALRIGPGLDRRTLRQAVVLAEVLAPPVSLREASQRAV